MTMTRVETLDRIERSWQALDDLAGGLDSDRLQTPVSDGWTVKDHLIHLAAWEDSLLALLESRDRAAAMGAPGLEEAGTDAINAAVHVQHRDDAPEEAVSGFRESHRRLLDRLGQLSDEDLSRPYSYYQPDADGPEEPSPVSGWIAGNTFEHYEEHLAYIRAALERAPDSR
ncbi:MAG: hypothetical protein DLM67_02360 [Candidatus Nephthysia bennettiae]|uniref:ClbS/DfsB family four-helix bundle protein n=1 Tax=Candidatus Nephthysia bennettiae TaxID=3127016 RepID=A0A934K6V1_9BACT|nr:ClbS/DfsB family four-helix bundle protein [Candidatus Dormibacteraeota bacterium]MBJ7615065.1 ClbS/DfsB family four-helix bundle protein [Candidatus Dormibacteraeota bacterium]PZS00045.1 MAG: hypothetical protein DLM67_02360 [Candidatus Dormibacteraeota bacterium]